MDTDTTKELTEKQKLFCEYFATVRDFFGNGTQAYIEAYNIDVSKKGAYAGARVNASNLLTNTNILKYIDSLLELGPLNDQYVDRQIGFLIEQNADFTAKMAAIKEYNALKQRITKKMELEIPGLLKTEEKLKEFLDDTNDNAYDEGSSQPPAAIEPTSGEEVADDTQDIPRG